MSEPGLSQRIRQAKSEAEVRALLEEGKSYEHASVQTKSRWQNVAERTIRNLAKQGDKKIEKTS